MLNWGIVTSPKSKGGLGIHQASLQNEAFITKLVWRAFKNPKFLRSSTNINKYTKDGLLNRNNHHSNIHSKI